MTVSEIKQAVDQGKTVHWHHEGYSVIKSNRGEYLLVCNLNNHCIGLTWQDGVTLNGEEEQFYIKES